MITLLLLAIIVIYYISIYYISGKLNVPASRRLQLPIILFFYLLLTPLPTLRDKLVSRPTDFLDPTM